ncbi:MAG: sensor histidine kinase [Actinomycetota bacterium]
MMNAPGDQRRLEQGMTYVRWFGIVFGIVGVLDQPGYPDARTQQVAWAVVVCLAIGSFAIWGWLGRIHNTRDLQRLGIIGYLLDAAIVMAFVWVYAFEHPYVTWALLLILPLEGALRYRLRGALLSAGFNALFFIAQEIHYADVHHLAFDTSTYIFVVGLSLLIAGVAGTMAENWRNQAKALEQQSLRLAEVDRLKDRFLAVTSHEIRGPLTAIITGVDTVIKQKSRLTEEQHDKLLEMVHRQGQQLARLVDDLLITSQIESDKLALHVRQADLEETIEHALEAAAGKRKSHQVELFIEPLLVEIDASRVGQIVRNLVENAFKYTPERTKVAVTAKESDAGITIEVADQGPGIPASKRRDLFEAFSRVDETAAGQEGVGLGLYVVSQLSSIMGGHIDLSSSSRGTTFSIYVPCEVQRKPAQLGLVESPRDASG